MMSHYANEGGEGAEEGHLSQVEGFRSREWGPCVTSRREDSGPWM